MTTEETISKLVECTAEVALSQVQEAVTLKDSEHAALWVRMLRDAVVAQRERQLDD